MSFIKGLQGHETAQTDFAEEVLILGRQLMDTMDLKTHVDQMQTEMNRPCDLKIRSLLEGLSEQLDGCGELITERLASFPPDLLAEPTAEVPPGAGGWRGLKFCRTQARKRSVSVGVGYGTP